MLMLSVSSVYLVSSSIVQKDKTGIENPFPVQPNGNFLERKGGFP
jgi:hypothetical protein